MKLLDEKQGFYGQVAVVEINEDLLLKHNGKTDASTNVRDNRGGLHTVLVDARWTGPDRS